MRSNKEILDPHISNCMSEMYILEAMKEAQIEILNEVINRIHLDSDKKWFKIIQILKSEIK